MNDIITIESAAISESNLLSILFKTVYIDTYGSEGVTNEFANFIETKFSPTKIKENIESEHCDLWVAKFMNNPVGILQVEYANPCPITKEVLPEVNKLYILNRFFGKGIGQKLMKAAEKDILDKGNNSIWLWLLESNERALNFYTKQGYRNIGTAFFQMETNNYKNIVMQKNFH